MSTDVADLLSDPLVLRAAWRRVRAWYRTAEWTPEPSVTAFEIEAPARLAELGAGLAADTWRPRPFPLIPYPKSASALRHYCVPDVEAQVAFGVLGVLLGPIIDSAVPSFAFGNRWHRGARRDRSGAMPHWSAQPYALDSASFFLPYRRDYGLFRRVAHWTACALVGAEPDVEASAGHAVRLEDYPKESIPPFASADWWGTRTPGRGKVGHWARLDLRLAYPSVRHNCLKQQLNQVVLSSQAEDLGRVLSGYPSSITAKLLSPETRSALALRLSELLQRVRYVPGNVGMLWRPSHVAHQVPSRDGVGHAGLPTGLAISGVLLNAYLAAFDQRMEAWMQVRPPGSRVAFLRFADDMIIISETRESLAEAIDGVWTALENDEAAVISRPRRDALAMNLRVNWGKVDPPSIASSLKRCLSDAGWTICKSCDLPVEPKRKQPKGLRFHQWYQHIGADKVDWRDAELSADRIGPFVTHLVERISFLGNASQEEQFGDGAANRLVELHQLVHLRLECEDGRDDTRIVFAANRLAEAFLPEEGTDSDEDHNAEIRRSIGEAMRRAPWKFVLWRAVIRAACRRSFGPQPPDVEERSQKWLISLLGNIADARLADESAWSRRTPEAPTACVKHKGIPELYASFHRAYFWRSLCAAVRDLDRVPRREVSSDSLEGGIEGPAWRSSVWTFRALDERQVGAVASWLGAFDRWFAVLYGEVGGAVEPMEMDALAIAAMMKTPAEAVLELAPAVDPRSAREDASGWVDDRESPRLQDAVERAGRNQAINELGAVAIVRWTRYQLARSVHSMRRREAAEVLCASFKLPRLLYVAQATGLLHYISQNVLPPLFTHSIDFNSTVSDRLRMLWDYHLERLAAMSSLSVDLQGRSLISLYAILWNVAGEDHPRRIVPSAAPAIGLPIRVALRLLRNGLRSVLSDIAPESPSPWVFAKAEEVLAERDKQLRDGAFGAGASLEMEIGKIDDWLIPPHAAYFLPQTLGGTRSSFVAQAWTQLLQFFLAATGNERFHDAVIDHWPAPVPLEERWDLRAQLPMPSNIWRQIDVLIREALRGKDELAPDIVSMLVARIGDAVHESDGDATSLDFSWDRIDVSLTLGDDPLDFPVGCIPFHTPSPPLAVPLRTESLATTMRVRVAQLTAEPDWKAYRAGFLTSIPPRISRAERRAIMAQIDEAFSKPAVTAPANAGSDKVVLGPLIFPEVALPRQDMTSFLNLVRRRGRAALIGLTWDVQSSAYHRTAVSPTVPIRYLINDALLAVPVFGTRDPSVPVVRSFRVRKPLPTHVEEGLARSLTAARVGGSVWRMLPGRHWYRFVHPSWGDFTVAICSDILDPAPWHSLQGEVLHLFLICYNPDVTLFESLSWVRAFELHANVIGTNHGHYGGSFGWTPKRSHQREIANFRGNGIFILADIDVPVKDLELHQRNGVEEACQEGQREWDSVRSQSNHVFRAPPPGFRRR